MTGLTQNMPFHLAAWEIQGGLKKAFVAMMEHAPNPTIPPVLISHIITRYHGCPTSAVCRNEYPWHSAPGSALADEAPTSSVMGESEADAPMAAATELQVHSNA